MQVILVDTFGFFFRSYYALPPLQNSKNFPTSLLAGFATLILNLYKDYKDSCIIFTLEGGGSNIRKEFYAQYKANRKEAPQDLLLQLPVAIDWLHKMDLPTLSLQGYEADDCIATLATLAKRDGFSVKIMSHDKDLYQLIDDDIQLFDYAKKQPITQKECQNKFGVMPKDFIMYQSIVGDSSDNVPGIKGIGPKGAQNILVHFKSLESLYCAIDNDFLHVETLLGKRTAGLIKNCKNEAFISRELVTLKKDLLQNYDFANSKNTSDVSPLLSIADELESYELQRILQKILPRIKHKQTESKETIKQNKTSNEPTFDYISHLITDEIELFRILNSIPKDSAIAFDCETNGLDVRCADMVGFSFCFDGKNGYYVPFLHGNIKRINIQNNENLFSKRQQELLFNGQNFQNNNKKQQEQIKQISQQIAKKALEHIFKYQLIGHNIKFDMHITYHNFGIKPKHTPKDSMLLAWLDDPSQSVGLDNLMQKHFNYKMIAFSDVVPKNATFDCIELEIASKYAAEDSVATFHLYKYLSEVIEPHLLDIANTLEFPFISTLCVMEDSGIAIDYNYFKNLKTTFSQTLQQLQQDIYEKAGCTFNINSPQQVAHTLFEVLKLDTKRKGKSGYSTDEQTLNILKDLHPVVPLLLEYREMFKLFSTYIEPILKLCKHKINVNENRIYTSFIQTGTNTGRLSSKSPNLQNIPVRSKLGKSIRKGFVSKDGYTLLSLDYSQIELRLLAHFSKDCVLLESFHNNADIHAETAKILFPNESDKDFSLLRSIAKSINFGLIYGMGARKLAQTLNISQQEASNYIKSYFATFPNVEQFLQIQKDSILANGYSQTLLGRKRHFDFMSATEFMRSNFLREGVNTIFQGSAADLIKLSMNAIYKQILAFHNNSCNMLLQVHDELIFEVKTELAEILGKQIKDIMENIYKLRVPLICNLAIGNNWAALK